MNMIATKKVYVLSDTRKIGRFSNIPVVPKRNANYFVIPAFESMACIEYVKTKINHPYYVVRTQVDHLETVMPTDSKIAIITNMYCSLDDTKVYIDYDILEPTASGAEAGVR